MCSDLYKWFKISWSHVSPPYHLHQFGLTSINKLISKCKLNILDTYFTPINLIYEIRGTYILSKLKKALISKDIKLIIKHISISILVIVIYSFVRIIDKLYFWKNSDFEMHLIISPE